MADLQGFSALGLSTCLCQGMQLRRHRRREETGAHRMDDQRKTIGVRQLHVVQCKQEVGASQVRGSHSGGNR